MDDLFFISKALVLKIHQQQIERFGGAAHLRDEGLLESALGAAEQTWHYTEDIFQVAAQYCVSIAINHPFLDGNKRTATACMLVFLSANQYKPCMTNAQLYEWVIMVTTRQFTRQALADLLQQSCVPN
ncbi:MAG: type II toxin-antitoxin system death-on-curing family toxin [Methylococcales bacterium]